MAGSAGTANAADDGWSLYWWDGDKVHEVQTSEKFSDMGLDRTVGTSLNGICLKGTDGKTFVPLTSFSAAEYSCNLSTDAFQNNYGPGSLGQKANPGHSARGGAIIKTAQLHSNTDGDYDANLPVSLGDRLSIDEQGRLWVGHEGAAAIAQDSDSLEFNAIVGGAHWSSFSGKLVPTSYNSNKGQSVLLLGKPRTQTSTATVVQMPSSGDPAASAWQRAVLLAGLVMTGLAVCVPRLRGWDHRQI